MEMDEMRVPKIIRMQQEWERQHAAMADKDIANTEKERPKRRSSGGVYCGPWPKWRYLLFRLTGAACFLPPPFGRG
ncbi:MAG: hypothetical protein H6Q00_1604 [Holophagaceae bacterium]|nr:hypothetical protein [Holophagaceae bacterium]